MMKKLLLFVMSGALAVSVNAQQQAKPAAKTADYYQDNYNYVHVGPMNLGNRSAEKTTAASPRWYVPYDILNALNGYPFGQSLQVTGNRSYMHMWFDSTMYIKYSNSPSPSAINFCSAGQIIDPVGLPNALFNDPSFNNQDVMWVNGFNQYKVDSVMVVGAFIKNQARPSSIVDTLILSLAPQTGSTYYLKSNSSWISNYVPSGDTMFVFVPRADSINRAALASGNNPIADRLMWKVPLVDSMRDTVNTQNNTITVRTRTFQVPNGGLTIPAGSRVAMTVTFKSGDTWVPRVDTIQSRHHFRMMFGFVVNATGPNMPYKFFDPSWRDRNHSSLMFTTDTSDYRSTYAIEGTNPSNNYTFEYANMGARIVCPDCWRLDVKNVEGNLIKGGAYPNPAVSFVNVPFELKNAADVNVTLRNTVGQVVAAESFKNVAAGTAKFNTAALSNGVYLYTIEVDGQQTTGRIAVSH